MKNLFPMPLDRTGDVCLDNTRSISEIGTPDWVRSLLDEQGCPIKTTAERSNMPPKESSAYECDIRLARLWQKWSKWQRDSESEIPIPSEVQRIFTEEVIMSVRSIMGDLIERSSPSLRLRIVSRGGRMAFEKAMQVLAALLANGRMNRIQILRVLYPDLNPDLDDDLSLYRKARKLTRDLREIREWIIPEENCRFRIKVGRRFLTLFPNANFIQPTSIASVSSPSLPSPSVPLNAPPRPSSKENADYIIGSARMEIYRRLEVLRQRQKEAGIEEKTFSPEVKEFLIGILSTLIEHKDISINRLRRNVNRLPLHFLRWIILAMLVEEMLSESKKGISVKDVQRLLPDISEAAIATNIGEIRNWILLFSRAGFEAPRIREGAYFLRPKKAELTSAV